MNNALEITKSDLEKIYYNNTNDKACEILNISKVTLLKYIKQAGIIQKGKGNPVGLNYKKIKIIG